MSLLSLIEPGTLLTYSIAVMILIIAPGPGQALIVARTLQGGTRAGLITVAGLHVGTLVHTVAAATGLSVVLATSANAFAVVKYVGAIYLITLGVLTLQRVRKSAVPGTAVGSVRPASEAKLLAHAVVTGVLNPKVAIFFIAFLPQFVHPERGRVFGQFALLGLVFIVLGCIGDGAVAFIAGLAKGRVLANERYARWRETLVGAVLVALGVRLALLQRQ